MPSLYEILEVPPNATKAEIKRAYRSLALKTHPDRAPPEQKRQAEEAFQKINAAYEILTNDTARQEYDSTGRIPSNSASGSSSMPSSPHAQPGFFNPFGSPAFGFGTESLFSEHQRFGAGFSTPFFNSSAFVAFDPFGNDPFFNPTARRRTTSGFAGFPSDGIFRDFEGMMYGFPQPSSAFGSRHGNSLQDPPAFPFGPSGFQRSQFLGDSNQQRGGNGGFQSSSFSSTTTSTYRDGKWTSESVEESNVNGQRKTQAKRVWTDEQGVRHVEQTLPDGSRHYLREGENQSARALPPLASNSSSSAGHTSSRSGRHRA